MQEGLVSVIVPVASGDNLTRCVESLTNQTYENLEIILVNIENSDFNAVICANFEQTDERVKLISNNGKSVASAKNTGLDYASGEFVTFVNSNNFVDKDYIYILNKNLLETNSDISICSLCRYYEAKVENIDPLDDEVEIEVLQDDEAENGEENSEIKEENLELENDNEVEIEVEEELEENGAEDSKEDEEPIDEETEEDENEEVEKLEEEVEKLEEEVETSAETLKGETQTETIEPQEPSVEEKYNIKLLDKKKIRKRVVIFEGEDITEYFLSGVEKIKTAPFAKLYRKSIFNDLRFEDERINEDEFIAHKIYEKCNKFVRTSTQLYYYNVEKKPFKNVSKFVLKDLDRYYAMEERFKYFETTKWKEQALNQMLVQIRNIYCFARAGKADSNILKFLKHKYKLYYSLNKHNKLKDKCFKKMPNLYYFVKIIKTKNL